MGSADAWVQDWWTYVTSVLPMTNGPAWSSPRWAGFCRFSSNQNQCFVPPLRAHSMLRSSKVDGWIGLGKSYPTIYF